MTSGEPQKRLRDRAKRQDDLIAAALTVVATKGYKMATTVEIARTAGCSPALITQYFGGKEGLLNATVERRLDRRRAVLQATPAGRDLERELTAFLLANLDSSWNHRELHRLLNSQSFVDPVFGRLHGRVHHQHLLAILTERFTQYQELGRIREDMDARAAANLLAGTMSYLGVMSQIVWGEDRNAVQEIAGSCAKILAAGLAPANQE